MKAISSKAFQKSWIAHTDELPPDEHKIILVWNGKYKRAHTMTAFTARFQAIKSQEKPGWCEEIGYLAGDHTHWMPIYGPDGEDSCFIKPDPITQKHLEHEEYRERLARRKSMLPLPGQSFPEYNKKSRNQNTETRPKKRERTKLKKQRTKQKQHRLL